MDQIKLYIRENSIIFADLNCKDSFMPSESELQNGKSKSIWILNKMIAVSPDTVWQQIKLPDTSKFVYLGPKWLLQFEDQRAVYRYWCLEGKLCMLYLGRSECNNACIVLG